MAINMSYCRVRNVLAAVEELVGQLEDSTRLSEEEHAAALSLLSPARNLIHLLQETYTDDDDEE